MGAPILINIYVVAINVPSKLCVCVHTGHETSAHKKTWSAHKCSFLPKKCFCTYSYTSFQIQMSSDKTQ